MTSGWTPKAKINVFLKKILYSPRAAHFEKIAKKPLILTFEVITAASLKLRVRFFLSEERLLVTWRVNQQKKKIAGTRWIERRRIMSMVAIGESTLTVCSKIRRRKKMQFFNIVFFASKAKINVFLNFFSNCCGEVKKFFQKSLS